VADVRAGAESAANQTQSRFALIPDLLVAKVPQSQPPIRPTCIRSPYPQVWQQQTPLLSFLPLFNFLAKYLNEVDGLDRGTVMDCGRFVHFFKAKRPWIRVFRGRMNVNVWKDEHVSR
jgi:hypothetical protein